MKFSEVVNQARTLLHSKGRITYRALKREFDLDDEALEDLKEELIEAERVAVDENGKILVWTGTPSGQSAESTGPPPLQLLVPRSHYSPAERRQLTVMFCDLVGSTALSTQLDPEDLRTVILAYRETCASAIARFGGQLAKYIGDGLLVYFGYPTAHEDDAHRAVRTAIGIVEAMQQLSFPAIQLPRPLQVRIGIHTGLVVAGEMGVGDQSEPLAIVGETPNIAARLQEVAAPNTVVISGATYRLVQGLCECLDLSSRELKGLPAPLSMYQVVGESTAQSRFEAAVQKGLTSLVGRTEELKLLRRHWEQAKASAGQVVLLSGEPGIGKSRLVQELKEQLVHEGATHIEFRCSPYHQNSALYPIIDYLQHLLQFAREDTPTVKLEKLQHILSHYRFPQADTAPLLAALLSLPHPEGYPLLTGSPQKQKEKTQAAIAAWLVEEAERKPVYTTWEDVHWADPSTLEVLTLVVNQAPTARLYVMLTFRPEFVHPWGNRSHLSQLTLSRLGHSQVETLVERVTGGKSLPSEVVQHIVAKTDGVPLFVEELTKTVVESGFDGGAQQAAPAPSAIPATLHDSLMARLDRLGSAKEIAQLGATLGREFRYELLLAVSSLEETMLQHRLKQLVEAELLYQHGLLPQASFFFKHALIQDTAYQSLLKSRRQQLHQEIAYVLAEQFPETKENQPELLAHHYTEAGVSEQAIPYWQQAGQRAVTRSANVEAVAHLTKGLELLQTLPETPERAQQELALQLTLSDAMSLAKGYTALEVEQSVIRARELCLQMGETPQLFPALFRLAVFSINRGEFQITYQLSEQLLRLAQRVQDGLFLSQANMARGCVLYYLGELTAARPHLEQVSALYDPQKHPRSTLGAADPRVNCLSYVSWTLWLLGYPDQGLKRSQEAVALAEGLAHPWSEVFARGLAAQFYLLRREDRIARELAEGVMTLSTEQGFPYLLALGAIVRGWALTVQGQGEEGGAQMRQGLDTFRAMRIERERSYYLGLLAEAYGKGGQREEQRMVLAEALAIVDRIGEPVYAAELYRLKGELTRRQAGEKQRAQSAEQELEVPSPQSQLLDPESEAEACFLKAIEIARRQQAKSWELRAATSLARLWQQKGKSAEAHRMLSEIYNWFTEGFDTKDLQEAKALLEEMSQ